MAFALVAAAAALAVPAALGGANERLLPYEHGQGHLPAFHSPAAPALPQFGPLSAYEHGQGATVVRPDDRAGIRGVDVTSAAQPYVHSWGQGDARLNAVRPSSSSPALAARPDNRAGILGEPTPVAVQSSTSAGTGFDWGDYGIGMGGGVGLAALLLGTALALRHYRDQQKLKLKSA
jgi:hypothetical protein